MADAVDHGEAHDLSGRPGVRHVDVLARLAATEGLIGPDVDQVDMGAGAEGAEVDHDVGPLGRREQDPLHRDRLLEEPPSAPTCHSGVAGTTSRLTQVTSTGWPTPASIESDGAL